MDGALAYDLTGQPDGVSAQPITLSLDNLTITP